MGNMAQDGDKQRGLPLSARHEDCAGWQVALWDLSLICGRSRHRGGDRGVSAVYTTAKSNNKTSPSDNPTLSIRPRCAACLLGCCSILSSPHQVGPRHGAARAVTRDNSAGGALVVRKANKDVNRSGVYTSCIIMMALGAFLPN
jgi:hypothetical protein